MRDLNAIVASPGGIDFLAERGIFVEQEAFRSRLQAPRQATFAERYGTADHCPVYALQQIYIDCTSSMLDRIVLLDALRTTAKVLPFFLWIDTDLAGTDPLMLRFLWSVFGKTASVRLSPGANDKRELRFVPVDPARIEQALNTLETYVSQSITGRKKVTRSRVKARFEQLKAVFLQPPNGTHSQLNHRVMYFLLTHQAQLHPYSVLVSDLLAHGLLRTALNQYLNHLDVAIQVFNETVRDLQTQDIDAKVKPLPPDYLPLHFSCPQCRRRLRLRHDVHGVDHYAIANCTCQPEHRFYLGHRSLSIDELIQAGDWSPDVSLTLLMNDIVSGYIGGTSSTVYYGLVMKEVLEKVLHTQRVPILLPPPSRNSSRPTVVDSLLYRFLMHAE